MLVLKLRTPTEIDLLEREFYWKKKLYSHTIFFENERSKLKTSVNQAALSSSNMNVLLS